MSIQDDSREIEVRNLFGLSEPANRSRADTDAQLLVDGKTIDFELKSTTNGSVTTVRDFSMDHVIKWKQKHWIIGVYDRTGRKLQYCLYGSPFDMSSWIEEKANYIKPDLNISQVVPHLLNKGSLHQILGQKTSYSYEDAVRLHKKQYSKEEYLEKMDIVKGYSEDRMLTILQDRIKYLILRGSTLNNPHIPKSYFKGWPHITENHSQTLLASVRKYSKLALK